MQPFEVTILGCSSATPTSSRNPTAQVLNVQDRFFLIDCGEGTQVQIRRYKVKIQRIDHIFISHLHGDHYLGLPGLLGTMHLLGRDKPVHVYAPPGLKEIIETNHYHSKTFLKYDLVFHVIEGNKPERIFEDDKLTVDTIPMDHRIACYGFLFREKPLLRNLRKDKLEEYSIPVQQIPKLKEGHDLILPGGNRIPNAELTTDPPPPRSYACCSDTIYTESYIEQIRNVNLLYHEATFAVDQAGRAKETHHCTAGEAGMIAQKAGVNKLIIGHYSARYRDLGQLLKETKENFIHTVLAIEGETYKVEGVE